MLQKSRQSSILFFAHLPFADERFAAVCRFSFQAAPKFAALFRLNRASERENVGMYKSGVSRTALNLQVL